MSISKLGTQHYRVRVMVDGKRASKNVRGTRADAKAVESELRKSLEEINSDKRCLTIAEFWEDFMAHCKRKGLAPSTISGYRKDYWNHIESELGDMRLDEVSPREVSSLLGSKTFGTAKHVKALLSAMFAFAEELGIVEQSVMRRKYTMPARTSVARKANLDVLDMKTMEMIADEGKGEPWEAYFILMAFAGLRREEAAAIKPEDVSEHRGLVVVRVCRTLQIVDGKQEIGVGKTDDSSRVAVVVSHGERLLELCREAGEWLTGEPANPDAIAKQYEAWFKYHAYKYIPMKNLRASFSTALTASGVDAAMVSKMTGHKGFDVQYRHYLRPGVDDFIDALAHNLPGYSKAAGPNHVD